MLLSVGTVVQLKITVRIGNKDEIDCFLLLLLPNEDEIDCF